MRQAHRYRNLEDLNAERDSVAWYWRLIALAASWMILGGYLIFPAAYDKDPQLRFSPAVLTVVIVTLMATGYSFTALLCIACPSWHFQAESIFFPSLCSCVLGFLTVLWAFASSTRFEWNKAAIICIALAATSSVVYGGLLLWTHSKIGKLASSSTSGYSDTAFYKNFITNMYPSMRKTDEHVPLTEDERIGQQMASLLSRREAAPSPAASQSTFRIDLPEEREHEMAADLRSVHSVRSSVGSNRNSLPNRPASSIVTPSSLGSPPVRNYSDYSRRRSGSLYEQAAPVQNPAVWERRSRAGSELTVEDAANRGRSANRSSGDQLRAVSREERRREIELSPMAPAR